MAFICAPTMGMRTILTMGKPSARRRRGSGARAASPRGRAARLDPIIDDGDVDTTDITTYASCGKCFNSIMLAPSKFKDTSTFQVRCNVCDLPVTVTLDMLENISGEPFNAAKWRMRQVTDAAMGKSQS